MSKQRHIVKRLELEVQVPQEKDGASFQRKLQRTHRNQLEKIIDRICSNLSDSKLIHRIEKLELDLGTIPPEDFEKEFVARFENSFKDALQLHTRPFSTKKKLETRIASHGEIVEMFLETGTLPWWVDMSQKAIFAESFSFLLEAIPSKIKADILPQLDLSSTLERIIHHLNDDLLYKLGDMVLPGFKQQWPILDRELIRWISSFPGSSQFPQKSLRLKRWKALFFSLKTKPSLEELFRQVLLQVAMDLRMTPSLLRDHVTHSLIEKRENHRIKEILLPLVSHQDDSPNRTLDPGIRQRRKSKRDSLVSLIHSLQDFGLPLSITKALKRFMDRWEMGLNGAKLKSEAAILAKELAKEIPNVSGKETQGLKELVELLRTEINETAIFDSILKWVHTFSDDLSIAKSSKQEEVSAQSSSFSQAEELYITNAGLVILWPFLNQLFEIAEWVEKGRFLSKELIHKASLLLQVLVDRDSEVQEYMLPLNKVLCGLKPETVARLDFHFSDEEKDACDAFLESVIKQAPILNEMSLAGFRQTFLQRKGILSVRDGGWLLRVERETYDVVLDKFPWSFQFLRLPWMEAPLFIEW